MSRIRNLFVKAVVALSLCLTVTSGFALTKEAPSKLTLDSYIQKYCKKNCVQTSVLRDAILRNAARFTIKTEHILTLVRVESRFVPTAKNASSHGLMQVHTKVHREKFRGKHTFDPDENIRVGSQIFATCLTRNKGDIRKTAKCYNGGGNRFYVSVFMAALKEASTVEIVPEDTLPFFEDSIDPSNKGGSDLSSEAAPLTEVPSLPTKGSTHEQHQH